MLTVRSTINIASQTVPPIIPVVQGDTGRAILFTLADFTIPAGATATYYVQKPSGEAVYNNATIDGNNVLVELTAQSIIEKGDNYGQVRITVGEEVVTSFDFILLVKEFRGIDAVQSLTEMNIFDKAVEQASEAIDEVKTDALEAIDDAKDEAIEEVTSNFDLKLDASSTKGVQNQVITQAINTVNNAIGDLSGETVTPTATNNYGIGGSVGQVIETWATTDYWHGIYTVTAGNTYGITTVSDFPQQIVVWFTNSSNVILEIHKAFATDHVEMVCTAPAGATKLFVMSYGYDAYHGTVQKVEPLSETVSNLKDDFYDSLVTDTASGAIASFPDGADNVPVKSLTVDIEPVQSGTGDPSPDNVRPISGWTQAVVTRCGKNIADFTNGYTISGTGLPSSYAKRSATVTPIPIKEGKAYRFLCTGTHICGIYSVLDAENNLVRRVTGVDSGTVLNTSDGAYLYVCGYDTSDTVTVTADGNNMMVVLDTETDTAYEPYNGQEYTIDLNGTRYGGTLDVTTGVLTVDRAIVDMGTLPWNRIDVTESIVGYQTESVTNIKLVGSNADIANIICSAYKASSVSRGYAGVDKECITENTIGRVTVYTDGGYADETAFKNAMVGQTFVYPLAIPQTIQLSAQEVRTLLGQNNVFADCGDVSVEYRADTKLYINKVLNA